MTYQVIMNGTHKGRTMLDIQNTVFHHQQIIPSLIPAHALSGCDTVGYEHAIEKGTMLKILSHTIY